MANALRLLSLPQQVKNQVSQGLLTAGHARVLAGVSDQQRVLSLATRVIDEGLSVRQLEELAREQPAPAPAPAQKKQRVLPPELKELETSIREVMGVKATLSGSEKKGKIVLQYSSRQ